MVEADTSSFPGQGGCRGCRVGSASLIGLFALWLALAPRCAAAVQPVAYAGEADADTTFLEIGVLDGDRARIFGQIEDVDVDSDGNIVVLDRRSYAVSWFAADGRFLGVVGREGGGPEEFRGPEGMAIGPNNDVYVLDAPERRVLVFALSDDGPVAVRTLSVVPVFAGDICIRDRGSDARIVLLGRAPPATAVSPLVHVFSLDGDRVSSFGLPVQEPLDATLPAVMRRTLEHSNNRGHLSCASSRVAITSERLGIVRAYSALGDLDRQVRLDDFAPVGWTIEGRRVRMGMDPDLGRANTISAVAALSDEAVLLTLHEASSTEWSGRHSLIVANLENGEQSASHPKGLIATKVVRGRLYGYVNDPFPRVVVRSIPAWLSAAASDAR